MTEVPRLAGAFLRSSLGRPLCLGSTLADLPLETIVSGNINVK